MEPARQEILGKLKKASGFDKIPKSPNFTDPVYYPVEGDLAEIFKINNELISGKTLVFDSEEELFHTLKNTIEEKNLSAISCFEPELREKLHHSGIQTEANLPENVDAGITGCEFLVAHTGSAVVSSAQPGGRRIFVYPPVHIVVATSSQIVDYLETAYQKIFEKYNPQIPSLITTISGPSRTADIEKTMVFGAHGPKELFIFISKK